MFDNDEQMKNILIKILENKEEYCSIAEYGQQWAIANFNYKDVGIKFKNFIGL